MPITYFTAFTHTHNFTHATSHTQLHTQLHTRKFTHATCRSHCTVAWCGSVRCAGAIFAVKQPFKIMLTSTVCQFASQLSHTRNFKHATSHTQLHTHATCRSPCTVAWCGSMQVPLESVPSVWQRAWMSSTAHYHWCVCDFIFVCVCVLGFTCVSAKHVAEGMDVKHCILSLVCVCVFLYLCVCVRAWVYVC